MIADLAEINKRCERIGIYSVESFTESSERIQIIAINEFLDYIERLLNV